MDLSLLTQLHQVRILVVGDVMLDRYWLGDTARISPEAPVPVVKVNRVEDKVGGAANVARNIAHLGAKVTLIGLVGADEYGEKIAHLLTQESIESQLVQQDLQPTVVKMRVVSRHQQVVRLDLEESFDPKFSEQLVERLKSCLSQCDLVVFSDYNKGSLGAVEKMIGLARDAGKCVLVDPKNSDLSRYKGAHYVTPNLGEFAAAGGSSDSERLIAESGRRLLQHSGIDAMLLTRSERGMSLITGTEKFDYAAQVREVADVTGAGDTVIATLAGMLGVGFKPAQAVEIANVAAGMVVAKLGAATVSAAELRARLGGQSAHQDDAEDVSSSTALEQISAARGNGEKIVFTNGCFDILHAGHVAYLEEARALGDRLVVGLNNDESISRLKGADRPINGLAARARVLKALNSVDWVIPFGEQENEDKPAPLIEQVLPDVLVKGGDYQVNEISGAEFVLANGGTVKVVGFIDGFSSSKIIDAIRQHGD
ncbi:MAG: bifunctional D-glycero-beta-D-manno-heptose-7-phosphate kinase/D-glycero-beta-D-manno-heptose 1-phosphate adenylyltransferase HldE [Gammaproteobacteria bacterium]|jgi:D-beta-D-heptose 7-phosphate kinase/D-beta-D-heptose 1-phosphate adenosyltransferase